MTKNGMFDPNIFFLAVNHDNLFESCKNFRDSIVVVYTLWISVAPSENSNLPKLVPFNWYTRLLDVVRKMLEFVKHHLLWDPRLHKFFGKRVAKSIIIFCLYILTFRPFNEKIVSTYIFCFKNILFLTAAASKYCGEQICIVA